MIGAGASEITAEGLFSLGYPRKDGGEQINARVRLTRRPMADLKRGFEPMFLECSGGAGI